MGVPPAPPEQPAGEAAAPVLSDAARARFAVLRERFVAGLPARWQELQSSADPAARESMLHRLAGAAGSFQLPQLGAAARHAEHCCAAGGGAALDEALALLRLRLEEAGVTVR